MPTLIPKTRRIVGFVTLLPFIALVALSKAAPVPDAVLPDGGRYFGSLVDGRLEGEGRLEWANDARYQGGFRNGLLSGQGRMRFASGAEYEGSFADGMMSGQGRMVLPDGSVYTGEFRKDVFNGKGRHEMPAGTRYEGGFKDGQYWGDGELHYANGNVYRGSFVRNRLQGRGRFERADGAVYEGDFADGEFTGTGTYVGADGARYEGAFQAWQFHGAGVYTDAAGAVYEGTFSNGTLTGTGRYTGSDGSRYEGEFERGQFHGEGTLRLANGDVYKGGFRYGRFHGDGTLTYAKPRDGRNQLDGRWKYGQFDGPERDSRVRRNVETALYEQSALLERALATLAPGEPGKIDLYLLAVGGDGSQEVFRREVDFVKTQFDRDFGTAGRSLMLVNSRTTADALPMATVTSIGRSLTAIGSRMDKDEDILFLYLTSHGTRSHEFVLDQNGMDLRSLPAPELGALLQESGIRWKVVVVSACYSGGFIDHVKDDYTLVITAARHDRQSFGCADENDFTYFGRAFFKESLPRAETLVEAFRQAELLIRSWEKDEAAHSLPQIHSPPAILEQLRRWRAQLPTAAPTTARAE
jgi:hypothetical protein